MSCSTCGDGPTYSQVAELPDLVIPAFDSDDAPIDYTTGYTFVARIGEEGRPAMLELVTVAGFDGGVRVTFDPDEFAALPVGRWLVHVVATRVIDSKDRDVWAAIRVRRPILAPVP